MNRFHTGLAGLLCGAFAVAGGCNALERLGPDGDLDPRALEGRYSWVFQEWEQGQPRGYPVVTLSWELPALHARETFRVYARSGSSGGYALIATVTSCSDGLCRYGDTNIVGGRSYDYYVATVDEQDDTEIGSSEAIRLDVPPAPNLTIPAAPTAVSLDRAVFLRWGATGAQRYMVLGEAESGPAYLIGETDGTSFLDDRAENGTRYRYFLAGVDADGHVSGLSSAAEAFPRPDFYADIIYAHSDLPSASGFRFVASDTDDPIVGGTDPAAQWRLEAANGTFRIQPLGQTRITAGTFTTQLACGPGSETNCVDIRTAPPDAEFGVGPVTVETGNTYVLRVVGSDAQVRFAKVRVQGSSVDGQGWRLIVFDWAYQIRPAERTLNFQR